MPQTVEGAGVELAYQERGSGPAVILVHGIGDSAAGDGRRSRTLLEPDARVVTYDRRGYGGSGAPEPYEATTVQEQTEDAAALITAVGGAPATVCGCDFGALVCLDLARRHPRPGGRRRPGRPSRLRSVARGHRGAVGRAAAARGAPARRGSRRRRSMPTCRPAGTTPGGARAAGRLTRPSSPTTPVWPPWSSARRDLRELTVAGADPQHDTRRAARTRRGRGAGRAPARGGARPGVR